MTRSLLSCVFLSVCVAACAERERLNLNCEWNEEHTISLNLQNAAQQRHLNHDAFVAEEISIRYADLRRGHRSGHFEGVGEYSRTRDQCLETLTRAIAVSHDVTPMQVHDAVGRRDRRVDLAVLMAFTALYSLVAGAVSRRLVRRFLPDETWLFLLGTLVASVIVSAAMVMLGELGSSVVEMIRVSNTHLSYRAFGIPWSHHRPDLFVGGLLLFWLTAMITRAFITRVRGPINATAT